MEVLPAEDECTLSHGVLHERDGMSLRRLAIHISDASLVHPAGVCTDKNCNTNPCNDVVGGDVGFHWRLVGSVSSIAWRILAF